MPAAFRDLRRPGRRSGRGPSERRIALAAALLATGLAPALRAQPAESIVLQPSPRLAPAPSGDAARQRPSILSADSLVVRPDLDAVAEGNVEFRRAGTVIRARRLSYDSPEDLAAAQGDVFIGRDGMSFRGPELQLRVQRFEGFFLQPEFQFETLGAGGRAARVDFIDASRLRAIDAMYSSCPREDGSAPDWLLRTDRVRMDFETNVGIAEGAVLEFLGVPILGLPVMSFPLTDDRKSGWLPPSIGLDSRSGFELGVPYYWNIAPNRDATFTPTLLTRRGLALGSEFRYLEAHHSGRMRLHLLPNDRVAGRNRFAWDLDNDGSVGGADYRLRWLHVSDDDYWKDFPQLVPSDSPRLLSQTAVLGREWATRLGPVSAYARLQHWQVLQTGIANERIDAPYQRSPQVGVNWLPEMPWGLRGTLTSEFNRFTRPDDTAGLLHPTGWRWHALGQLSRPFARSGAWVTPRLSFNAASYTLDQHDLVLRSDSRVIPTASVDTGLVLERDTPWFGRPQRQTLEPRLLYVATPFRDQANLPNFDSAERDFNLVSIFSENAFTGVDRVSDGQQVAAGFTTRLVDAATGAETLRLGVAQRNRLTEQRVVLSGQTQTRRFSDVLIEGGTAVFDPWKFDASLQYDPDSHRIQRSIVAMRFQPGPFRTLSAGYRLTRGSSEQVELGWQWPVYRGTARPVGAAGGCGGTVYAVGRLNYSLRDSRMTDSTVGMEYDAGCWIGRVVAQRLSTGHAEATTRLLLQLELVGLSRLGANPLQVLKDNIPGYQLLREPRGTAPNLEP